MRVTMLFTGMGYLAACGAPRGASLESAQSSGVCPSSITWVYPSVPVLTGHVLTFARSHLNEKVGSGECADLPETALTLFGAENFTSLGPTGPDADYVWGNLVDTVTPTHSAMYSAVPGDIIQYHAAHFYWPTAGGGWQSEEAPHHTAVVEAVSVDGKNLCVLQQNAEGKRYVTYGYFNLTGLKSGAMHVYSPRF